MDQYFAAIFVAIVVFAEIYQTMNSTNFGAALPLQHREVQPQHAFMHSVTFEVLMKASTSAINTMVW